jgi:hypothetical protein
MRNLSDLKAERAFPERHVVVTRKIDERANTIVMTSTYEPRAA